MLKHPRRPEGDGSISELMALNLLCSLVFVSHVITRCPVPSSQVHNHFRSTILGVRGLTSNLIALVVSQAFYQDNNT
jgi:hypothetical protein